MTLVDDQEIEFCPECGSENLEIEHDSVTIGGHGGEAFFEWEQVECDGCDSRYKITKTK